MHIYLYICTFIVVLQSYLLIILQYISAHYIFAHYFVFGYYVVFAQYIVIPMHIYCDPGSFQFVQIKSNIQCCYFMDLLSMYIIVLQFLYICCRYITKIAHRSETL